MATARPTGQDDRDRYETASESTADSDLILVALEEATEAVDAALNATLERLFSPASTAKRQVFMEAAS